MTKTLTVGGLTLRVHVLDDGRRIIDAEDMAKFYEALGRLDFEPTEAELVELGRFARGGK